MKLLPDVGIRHQNVQFVDTLSVVDGMVIRIC